MVIRFHLPPRGRAQRRDGDRPGVVGVVLVRVPGRQQPHPGPQLRLHVQHPLTRGDQLPVQQMPSPPAPSTAQVRSGQSAAHATSRWAWAAEARTRSSPSGSSAAPIATAACEPLCGPAPIITAAISYSFIVIWEKDRGGHP
jgi:hypothetical protein